MSNVVLDSSVLLAILLNESYDDAVWSVLEGAVISAVSLTEVLSRLADRGLLDSPQLSTIFALLAEVASFTEEQARAAAALRNQTRRVGLSLGDRACLALAIQNDADVYTADRDWSKVDLPCRIHLIR